jgi:hypothetical protein
MGEGKTSRAAQMSGDIGKVFRINEAALQAAVVELARHTGWLIMHQRPAQVRPGRWITPTTGDVGFPDLVLAHPTRGVLFVELKTAVGRVSPEQHKWHAVLRAAGQEVHVWRPANISEIRQRLQGENNG